MKRTFLLGDEWLYYKLYCGARMSSIILSETIAPLMMNLLSEEYIIKWFFIRYSDPEYHLRLRMHLTDINKINHVIIALNEVLTPYVEDDIIYKIQTDTYIRELERYGSNTINLAEELFFHESIMLSQALDCIEDEELFFLFVAKAVHQLLNDFKLSITDKLDLVRINRLNFRDEFNVDKLLNKQLNKKYGGFRKTLSDYLDNKESNDTYTFLDNIINTKTKRTQHLITKIITHNENQSLEVSLKSLLSSYIHMLINRAFRSQQRFYELIIYDFLYKKYNSDIKQHAH